MLDLGCAAGLLGEELRRRGVATVVHGVELDPLAAAEAETRLDRVWTANLEASPVTFVEPPYDVIVAADVLEHMRDPWEMARQIRGLLAPNGQLVASLPNIRFVRVVLPLVIRGRFDYADSGVLDRTHLRFFTRSSMMEFFDQAGFSVELITRAPMIWRRGWKAAIARVLGDFATEQLLIRARVTP